MRTCAVALLCALAVARAAAYTVDCNHEYTDCDSELSKLTNEEDEIQAVAPGSAAVVQALKQVEKTTPPPTTTSKPFLPTIAQEITTKSYEVQYPESTDPTETEIIEAEPKDSEPKFSEIDRQPSPRLLNLNVEDLQSFANAIHNNSSKGSKKISDLSDVTLDDDEEEVRMSPEHDHKLHDKHISDKFYTNLQSPFHPLMSNMNPERSMEEIDIMCKDNGISYKIGDRIERGCEETCECTPGGTFDCNPRCRHPYIRRGRRLKDPLCFESPVDDCCSIITCATDLKNKFEVCKYGNDTHVVGSKWDVGCEQICTCGPNSIVTCKPRCKKHIPSEQCINVQDPNDECCEVQVCDVSHDAHEEPENATSKPNVSTSKTTIVTTETTSTTPSTTTTRKTTTTSEQYKDFEEEYDMSMKTSRPLVLPEPIGSVKVLQNNSVQVNLMHANNSEDPIHLMLSKDGGKHFDDVELKYQNMILNLEGGKDYILKTKETGTKFNFTITATDNKNVLSNSSTAGCLHDGEFYDVGEEFHIGCTELCECTGMNQYDCVELVCPSHVGLELVSKGCVRWAPSPPAVPPNCCPREARCISDGTCHYKGTAIPNWTEVPIALTGCEQRCFCENGELDCQEVCTPLPPIPPQTLRCPPQHRPAPVNISDEDCCKHWACVPNAAQDTKKSHNTKTVSQTTQAPLPPTSTKLIQSTLSTVPTSTAIDLVEEFHTFRPYQKPRVDKIITFNDMVNKPLVDQTMEVNDVPNNKPITADLAMKFNEKSSSKPAVAGQTLTFNMSKHKPLVDNSMTFNVMSNNKPAVLGQTLTSNDISNYKPLIDQTMTVNEMLNNKPLTDETMTFNEMLKQPQATKINNPNPPNMLQFSVADMAARAPNTKLRNFAQPTNFANNQYSINPFAYKANYVPISDVMIHVDSKNRKLYPPLNDQQESFPLSDIVMHDLIAPSRYLNEESIRPINENNYLLSLKPDVLERATNAYLMPAYSKYNNLLNSNGVHIFDESKTPYLKNTMKPQEYVTTKNKVPLNSDNVDQTAKIRYLDDSKSGEPLRMRVSNYLKNLEHNANMQYLEQLVKPLKLSPGHFKKVEQLAKVPFDRDGELFDDSMTSLHEIGPRNKDSKDHELQKASNRYKTLSLKALQQFKEISKNITKDANDSPDVAHLINQMEAEAEVNRNLERSADKLNQLKAGHATSEKPHLNTPPGFLPTIPPEIHYPQEEISDYDRPMNTLDSALPGIPPGVIPPNYGEENKKLSVISLLADSPTSIKLLFGLPPVLVGLRGSVDLRYTDEDDPDITHWYSQVFAPADEVLTTPRLEFRLTGLKPSTTYKIRGKLYLHNLPVEPQSEIYSVRTLDLPSLPTEEKRREIDSRLVVADVNDTVAHVSWRHFSEDELQYIDGIQVRYRPVGTPIYSMTELLHHSKSVAELKELRPGTRYEASLVLVPPPRASTELKDPATVQFTTAPYVDPYNWSVSIDSHVVGSEAAEVTWRGVPAPAERWVRVYRAAHACGNSRHEHDAFRLATRDLPPTILLTGLEPNTKCRVWLELFLTNGKIKTSNVLEINTKSHDSPEDVDNEIEASSIAGSRGGGRGDYYGALVVVGVVAALGALTSLLLLLVLVRRHRPRSVPITPVPSAPRESSLPPYDNPAYKLELQQETMDL